MNKKYRDSTLRIDMAYIRRKLKEQFQRNVLRAKQKQLCFIINEHDNKKKFIRFQLQFHLKHKKMFKYYKEDKLCALNVFFFFCIRKRNTFCDVEFLENLFVVIIILYKNSAHKQ